MARNNGTVYGTAFTVSIEAAEGVTTGISAADRAKIQVAVARTPRRRHRPARPRLFPSLPALAACCPRRPPRRAATWRHGGVSEPAAVICEIMNDDGTMARPAGTDRVRKAHGLKIGTIVDLIHYRAASETLVERVTSNRWPPPTANSSCTPTSTAPQGATHLALVKGAIPAGGETLVRVHEPCRSSISSTLQPAAVLSIDEAQAALARHGHGSSSSCTGRRTATPSPASPARRRAPRSTNGIPHLRHRCPDSARPRRHQDAAPLQPRRMPP